jgi:hypothetical protein
VCFVLLGRQFPFCSSYSFLFFHIHSHAALQAGSQQTYRLYSSSLDYFIKIEKQESILGFYKGMSSPIFDVTIINRIVFSIENLSKNFFYDPNTYFA